MDPELDPKMDQEMEMADRYRQAFLQELKESVPSYFLPRCVLDRWMLGDTPLLSIREAHMQNRLDHPRMTLIDWRTHAQKMQDDALRLQHILYTNQKVFAFIYGHLLQCISVFRTKFVHRRFPLIQFHLVDGSSAMEAVFRSGGKLVVKKSFYLHPFNVVTNKIGVAVAKIWVRMQVTDFNVHFVYEHRVFNKTLSVLTELSSYGRSRDL